MKYGIFPDEIIVPFGGDGKGEMVLVVTPQSLTTQQAKA